MPPACLSQSFACTVYDNCSACAVHCNYHILCMYIMLIMSTSAGFPLFSIPDIYLVIVLVNICPCAITRSSFIWMETKVLSQKRSSLCVLHIFPKKRLVSRYIRDRYIQAIKSLLYDRSSLAKSLAMGRHTRANGGTQSSQYVCCFSQDGLESRLFLTSSYFFFVASTKVDSL